MPHGFLALLFGQFEHRKKSQDKPGLQRGGRTRYNENLQLGGYPVHYDLPAPSLTLEVALYRRASCNGAASVGKYTEKMEAGSAGADESPHRREWRDD